MYILLISTSHFFFIKKKLRYLKITKNNYIFKFTLDIPQKIFKIFQNRKKWLLDINKTFKYAF